MTTGTTDIPKVSTALETKKPVGIAELIQKSADQLKMALPKHMNPERIVRIALTTLRLNPKLYECEPQSFLAALFQSAQLGLEPNLNGESWLIPYDVRDKQTGGKKKVVQFQVGAYGLVKLYWNHQNATSLQVEKVYKNDTFEYDLGSCELHHKPAPFGQDRGEVIGYYAYAGLANGGRQLKVLSKKEAFEFGKKFSKCWDKSKNDFMDYTPWKDHFDAMAMKTVLKQLMKLLPKSVEIQRALAMDETVKTKIDVDMVEVPNEDDFSDAEEVKEEKKELEIATVDPMSALKEASAKQRDILIAGIRTTKTTASLKEFAKKLDERRKAGEITEKDDEQVVTALGEREEALKL